MYFNRKIISKKILLFMKSSCLQKIIIKIHVMIDQISCNRFEIISIISSMAMTNNKLDVCRDCWNIDSLSTQHRDAYAASHSKFHKYSSSRCKSRQARLIFSPHPLILIHLCRHMITDFPSPSVTGLE